MEYNAISRKFGRNYELRVQKSTSDDYLVIEPPFTINIVIQRNILSSVNNANIRIFNLSEDSRNQIQKDAQEISLIKKIELRAGYGNNLYTIFSGNVMSAYSVREGTDYITEIEAFDGGFAVSRASIEKTLAAGTSYEAIVNSLVNEISKFDVKKGSIGTILGTTTRGFSLNGNAYSLLQEITGNRAFIDNKKINVLSSDEIVIGAIPIVSSDSGLLGTPRAESTRLTFQIVFEPRLIIGQKIEIQSSTQKKLLDGRQYKIVSLTHRGTFSDSVSGSVVTEVGCFFGLKGFKAVRS